MCIRDRSEIAANPNVIVEQNYEESLSIEYVQTDWGPIQVTVQGSLDRPVILTYPDFALNHRNCFEGFFQCPQTAFLRQNFCIVHVDGPYQEESAPLCENPNNYPSLTQMGQQIQQIIDHLRIPKIICFAVGIGGHVLCNFAIENPGRVEALILISTSTKGSGWFKYIYQYIGTWVLSLTSFIGKLPWFVVNQIMWRYFTQETINNNPDLTESIRRDIEKIHPLNLYLFLDAVMKKQDITSGLKKIKSPSLFFVSFGSTYQDDMQEMFEQFKPDTCSLMEIRNVDHLITEEAPTILADPIKNFLIGLGYIRL
eukprot:TRINITY_DN6618_c0_g1_i1.p1 TRINITY_DN6618_c0_g1~~TRINITY_DN6618_c0_g1_i1.p1  ORF type:complete len:312 (-),score=48.79 TRINITY_DN6618_c0_g1_i1:12-947(-)